MVFIKAWSDDSRPCYLFLLRGTALAFATFAVLGFGRCSFCFFGIGIFGTCGFGVFGIFGGCDLIAMRQTVQRERAATRCVGDTRRADVQPLMRG